MNSELYTVFIDSKNSFPILYYTIIFFLAASAATFLNVLLHRMPIIMGNSFTESALLFLDSKNIDISDRLKMENIEYNTLWGRSFCPSCREQIPIWFNVPILGWLILRGKSHCCSKPISPRYIIIELGFTFLCLAAFYFLPFVEASFVSWFLFLSIAIAHIDLKTQLIPDEYSYILLWSGFLYAYLTQNISIEISVFSAAFAYVAIYMIDKTYGLIRGGNGIGLGDIKLYAACTAWLGYGEFAHLALYSSLLGIAMFAFSSLAKRNKILSEEHKGIPFAPAIVISAISILIFNIA